MRAVGALGLFMVAAACGRPAVHRPLTLDVQGVSGRTERLVVKVFPESLGVRCSDVSLLNVASLESPVSVVWTRASGAPRRVEIPEVDEPALTVTVHTEDAAGAALQLGCAAVDYAEIESPEVLLTLG